MMLHQDQAKTMPRHATPHSKDIPTSMRPATVGMQPGVGPLYLRHATPDIASRTQSKDVQMSMRPATVGMQFGGPLYQSQHGDNKHLEPLDRMAHTLAAYRLPVAEQQRPATQEAANPSARSFPTAVAQHRPPSAGVIGRVLTGSDLGSAGELKQLLRAEAKYNEHIAQSAARRGR